MSNWPPRYEDHFDFRMTGTPPYYRVVQSELQKRGALRGLTPREQFDLIEALYMIDMTASKADRSLRSSPWTTSELFTLVPPKGAHPKDGTKARQKFEQWRSYREHQWWLRLCIRARRALLIGEWGKAIHAALYAGCHSNGALTISAQKSLAGLRDGSLSNHLRADRNREIILYEARELCAGRKKYNVKSIAMQITDKHKGEKGFPKYDSIRRTLGKDRSWESWP